VNDDFVSWKHHPITVVIFSELKARIEQLKEELVELARTGDGYLLAEKAGAVKAYQDVLDTQVEETNGN
jgi:hypothetical protein